MVSLITPEERYIRSYWESVNMVAQERKYLASEEGFPYESTVAFVREALAGNVPQIFVIDDELDICVGWCDAFEREPAVGYLGMGLRHEYRDLGIGTKMIEEIVERALSAGFKMLALDVRASNKRAIHLYEKMGFITVAVQNSGYQVNGKLIEENVVQMERNI